MLVLRFWYDLQQDIPSTGIFKATKSGLSHVVDISEAYISNPPATVTQGVEAVTLS